MDSADVMQEKCDRKIELLTKRNFERKRDLEKEQTVKRLANAENEQLDFFQRSFKEKREEIERGLDIAKDVKSEELAWHFDRISKDMLTLQKYVASSNLFLRGYDVKVYQQILQNLGNRAKSLEDELLPKKKFGFKNKKPKASGAKEEINGTSSHSKDEVDLSGTKSTPFESSCDFINETGKSLCLGGEDIFKKDVALTNLDKCTVRLFGNPSTLHINSVKNSYILTGPVSTSIFAENCENCTLVIACQQLRFHSSKNVTIYLYVTSRAIMEDCTGMLFAPYNLRYDSIQDDFQKAGLDNTVNNWMSIDDFNWLNIERGSPNWSVLSDEKRVDNWETY